MALAAAACGGGGERIEVRQTVPFGRQLTPPARPGGPAPLASAPSAESFGDDALLYRVGESSCAILRAGLDGLAAGLCGEPLSPRVYLRPDRPLRLAELIARFAPFELEEGDEKVVLHGNGSEVANPTERRMVLEWARRLMAEARGVTATRAYRLAFEWQRQLGGGRGCEAVAVYLSGEALASTCDGLRSTGVVPAERMSAVLSWHDRLAPFQAVREGGAGGEGTSTRLIFPGSGAAGQDDETVKTMIALAASIHGEVLASDLRRRQAEEERLAALDAASEEGRAGGTGARPAAPRPAPAVPADDAGDMTLSEAIAVGASPEGAESGADPTGEGGVGEPPAAVPPREEAESAPPGRPRPDDEATDPDPDVPGPRARAPEDAAPDDPDPDDPDPDDPDPDGGAAGGVPAGATAG